MKKIRYELTARQRPDIGEPIEQAHQRIFAPLAAQSGPWQLREMPPAPKIVGGNVSAHCNLRRYLPGTAKGYMSYSFRGEWEGGMPADSLHFEFTPDANTYGILITDTIPLLIHSMRPYSMELGDVRFRDAVAGDDGSIQLGAERACGGRLYPVFFLSGSMLRELYQLELDEAVSKLTPIAEQVTCIEDGLYVIGSFRILEFEEAANLAHRLEAALEPSNVGFFSRVLGKLGLSG